MKQQFITRSKKYEKEAPSKDAKKVYIFCEGQRNEVEYFKYFQGLDSRINIIPIPCENGKSDPTKLKENAIKLFFPEGEKEEPKYKLIEEYEDEIWFVIDTDRWNEGGKIDILRNFTNSKKFLKVAQSNPSFEMWLYYHFQPNKPQEEEVDKFPTFKAFVNDNVRGGFDNRKHPSFLERAIQNAEKNYSENGNPPQPDLYCTQVFRLGGIVFSFVKDKLK